jgi:metallophosphoesterase superfamily enzyme
MICRVQILRVLAASFLLASLSITAVAADTHVVSPADLQNELVSATRAQQRNLETVQQFVSSEKAQKAIKSAGIDPQEVKTAVSQLTNEELAELAARAEKAQADFAAGNLSDRDLILIILGVIVVVLIIVAVR